MLDTARTRNPHVGTKSAHVGTKPTATHTLVAQHRKTHEGFKEFGMASGAGSVQSGGGYKSNAFKGTVDG